MSRATETTNISSKHLPDIYKISTDLLREDTLVEPDPPVPCEAGGCVLRRWSLDRGHRPELRPRADARRQEGS